MLVFILAASLATGLASQNFTGTRRCTSELSDADADQLRAAFVAASTSTDFSKLVSDPFSSHGTPSFLPWHRRALHRFEDLLQYPIPYWDFSLEPIPALALEPRSRSTNAPNPLYSPKRKPTSPYPTETFLTLEMMAFAQLDFTHLSTQLENLFESVLASLGGDVSTLDTAPRDVLYWMALSNIDRIWWRWTLNHNSTQPPSSATLQLKDLSGPFSGAMVANDSSRWDPNGDWKDELAHQAAHPMQFPTDGHIDGDDLQNITDGAHVAMLMRVGHIQAHLGESKFSADNSERSYQGMVVSGNGTNPGLGGLGMTSTDNHEWHTEDVPPPNISSATGWEDSGRFYGAVPGQGAIHGLDGDPVPPTGNFLDSVSHSGNSMPGPTAQTDIRGGLGSSNATAPRMKGTIGKKPSPDGKGYVAIGHNVSHYTDVKPPQHPGEKSKVVASVAWSFASNLGWHNFSSAPRYMTATSTLPLKAYSSATHSLAVQQEPMAGDIKKRPPSIPVNTTTQTPPTCPYKTIPELFVSPPKMHMILSLCEVPVTESPFRVEIVAQDTVIGSIFIEGSGGLRTRYQRDRPVDITEGYNRLLKQVPLQQIQDHLVILMYNEKTGKMVKTPEFTVRLDQYVF